MEKLQKYYTVTFGNDVYMELNLYIMNKNFCKIKQKAS